jgi:acylphosphatase
MTNRITRKYYVSGVVQGVGYRYFAQRVARELKIVGWARNLEDGRVEVLAAGSSHGLNDFEAELRVGPPRAEVRHMAIETEVLNTTKLTGFQIR